MIQNWTSTNASWRLCGSAVVSLTVALAAGCQAPPEDTEAGAGAEAERAAPAQPPNVVIIFTDDQGYSDLGVFGAEGFETPNIDRMAAEGARLTNFYVASPVCSPSRAALLTGSYPQRVSVPRVLFPQFDEGLHPDEVTIADLLKPLGYATAIFGKWHLGHHPEHLPAAQGFDEYFGLPYSNDMTPDAEKNPNPPARRHPPLPLVEGVETVEVEPDQSQLTRRYTERGVDFIERNADRPFFLYLPHTMPHLPLYVSDRFAGASERGLYGDVIMEIDWSVGEILGTLDRLGLDDRTLVVFTTDNGPWLVKGSHSGSAEPLREGKGSTFEGGQRVPAIIRWPGEIPAGLVSDEIATTMDLFPTIAGITGAEMPTDRIIDGKDIWPIVSGAPGATSPHEAFFYYLRYELQAVRSGQWKLHVPHGYGTIEGAELRTPTFQGTYAQAEIGLSLFDLETDIGETTNVADAHPDVVERLLGLIEAARDDLGDSLTDRVGRNIRPPGRVAP
ncbi:MAG: sulfatase [Vicinamibacterales bacterium]|jgi:arylsulfatase A-like enzyme|nr:sulfatase [Vicinamibacterales bacterium]MDP6608821.1 sulfatase [Vicinamibacterales bacterium]HAK57240.1 arylsulfatase [Acidobacteriota bacterium]|tara:strand:+ start:14507 stop:16015 length:1509 start_codon:yes stop_codon:yes gene_type:complete